MDSLGVLRSLYLPVKLNILAPQILSFLQHDPIAILQLIEAFPDQHTLLVHNLRAVLMSAFLHKTAPSHYTFGLAQARPVKLRGSFNTCAAGELEFDIA